MFMEFKRQRTLQNSSISARSDFIPAFLSLNNYRPPHQENLMRHTNLQSNRAYSQFSQLNIRDQNHLNGSNSTNNQFFQKSNRGTVQHPSRKGVNLPSHQHPTSKGSLEHPMVSSRFPNQARRAR